MFFLIMIKSVTTKYDSPNIAYHCGEAYPWSYNNDFVPGGMLQRMPYQCTQKPDTCDEANYYMSRQSFGQLGFRGYTKYGT